MKNIVNVVLLIKDMVIDVTRRPIFLRKIGRGPHCLKKPFSSAFIEKKI